MKCKKHPKYQAIYQPQAKCKICWEIYITTHSSNEVERLRQENRKMALTISKQTLQITELERIRDAHCDPGCGCEEG